jgi:pyroglutamyl-peptidase
MELGDMTTALITGFEGYGGRGRNPSGETAMALDGRTVGGVTVIGRRLPVSYGGLAAALTSLIDVHQPDIVISVGLWPGEPVIRLERVGINVADFEIPDNDGVIHTDAAVSGNGHTAALASLPNREIRNALLAAGIPARISSTAGTFLCNATLYTTATHAATMQKPALTGFIHVPYLPEQVAELLRTVEAERQLELHQRADTASMELATMVHALEIAIVNAARALY